jgi:hypothetical protein
MTRFGIQDSSLFAVSEKRSRSRSLSGGGRNLAADIKKYSTLPIQSNSSCHRVGHLRKIPVDEREGAIRLLSLPFFVRSVLALAVAAGGKLRRPLEWIANPAVSAVVGLFSNSGSRCDARRRWKRK